MIVMIMSSYTDSFNDTVVRAYGEFPLLMPRWGYVVSAFVLFIIGFFGFFLNLMVILLMFKDRQLWTPLNIILFNLVCADFSVSVLGNPLTLISALFHRWIFGRTMCVMYGFFMALLGITSITTLTVISFERYLMVTRPLSSRHLSSKGAALSVLFIWSYSLALTVPPLLGWGNYVNEAANISCSVNWHEQSVNTLTYILFLFAMGQIVPLTIITFSYVNIIRTMKRNSKRLGRVSRAETRATTMVLIMIISFTVAWTPYSVFALMEQFATEGIVSPGAGVIPALVAKSSICYDPLIYVGMNTQFRQSIKRVFGIHSKRTDSHTDRGYNNTILSPACKLSTFNEITVRYNSSEVSLTPKAVREKNLAKSENTTSPNDTNETKMRPIAKISELCTIQENRLATENERSVTPNNNEEQSNRIDEVFGESCNLRKNSAAFITITGPNKYILSKVNSSIDSNNEIANASQIQNSFKGNVNSNLFKPSKTLKHSCSLELGGVLKEKRRKFSIETRLDGFIQPKTFVKDNVSNILMEQNFKHTQDSGRNYLCDNNSDYSDDENQ